MVFTVKIRCHGSTGKCDGLVSLLIIILIHDCVRIMLLDGYNFSLFVVVVSCFQGEGWENISTRSLEKAKTQTLRFVAAPRHVRVLDVRF